MGLQWQCTKLSCQHTSTFIIMVYILFISYLIPYLKQGYTTFIGYSYQLDSCSYKRVHLQVYTTQNGRMSSIRRYYDGKPKHITTLPLVVFGSHQVQQCVGYCTPMPIEKIMAVSNKLCENYVPSTINKSIFWTLLLYSFCKLQPHINWVNSRRLLFINSKYLMHKIYNQTLL